MLKIKYKDSSIKNKQDLTIKVQGMNMGKKLITRKTQIT